MNIVFTIHGIALSGSRSPQETDIITVANRIFVAPEYAEQFEEAFRKRAYGFSLSKSF